MNLLIDQARLQAWCADEALPWKVCVLAETASTNDWLRDAGRSRDVTGEVVFAEAQTSGRGQRENVWKSAPAQDILVSAAVRPLLPVALWPRLTQLAALTVCRLIEDELGLNPMIKWPNDILLGGKKVAGLLLETFHGPMGGFLVIGMGLNVNGIRFDGGLAGSATSLRLETPSVRVRESGLDRQSLAEAWMRHLHNNLEAAAKGQAHGEWLDAVRQRSWLTGKQVRLRLDDRDCWGRVEGLDAEGCLLLRMHDGELRTVSSADQVRAVV